MNTPHTPPELKPAPVFEPFRWVNPECVAPVLPALPALALATHARDVAEGVRTIVELLEFQQNQDPEEAPLLPQVNLGNLMRLAVSSLHLLSEAAAEFQHCAQQQNTPTSQG